jgi:hypothetical protein
VSNECWSVLEGVVNSVLDLNRTLWALSGVWSRSEQRLRFEAERASPEYFQWLCMKVQDAGGDPARNFISRREKARTQRERGDGSWGAESADKQNYNNLESQVARQEGG